MPFSRPPQGGDVLNAAFNALGGGAQGVLGAVTGLAGGLAGLAGVGGLGALIMGGSVVQFAQLAIIIDLAWCVQPL
jgi:hypothetical protein